MKRWMALSLDWARQEIAESTSGPTTSGSTTRSTTVLESEGEIQEAEEARPWWWELGEACGEALAAASAVFVLFFLQSRWTGEPLEWTEVSTTMITFFLVALWNRRRRIPGGKRLDGIIEPLVDGERPISKEERSE